MICEAKRHGWRRLMQHVWRQCFVDPTEVVISHVKRHSRPWSIGAESKSSRRPPDLLTKRKAVRQRKVDITEVLLTRGQVNAVRAAFKAGITPSRIARQFGISQSNVRKALASDESKK